MIKDIEKIVFANDLTKEERRDAIKEMIDREYVPKEEMQELLLNPKKYFFMCQSEVDTNYIPKSQVIERLRFYLNKLCWEERDVQALLDTVLKKLDNTIEADQPKWYKDVKK